MQHALTELTGITAPTLADEQGIAVGLLGHGGHIVLHAEPATGRCLVDVVTPNATPPARALEVVARRLGVVPRPA